MKKILTLSLFLFLLQNILISQNEFGAVGSYWRYSFEPHDGGGWGWTMIYIEKDTIIDGEAYKKYKRKHHFQPFAGPPIENAYFGIIQIKNDSVISSGDVILDFNMDLSDSLYIQNAGGIVDIQLAVDSIETEEIGGFEYKKWHGQKICINGWVPGPYESFTILETVGQIEDDYLFWNTDNCSIGGGFHYFTCYKNGDFTYPPEEDCVELFFTNTKELSMEEEVEIFPNPAGDLLNIRLENSKKREISILSLDGKELLNKKGNSNLNQLDISDLHKGVYLVKINLEGKVLVNRFVKR